MRAPASSRSVRLEQRPALVEVELEERPLARLRSELSAPAWERLEAARAEAHAQPAGRTVWSVNSTPRGGGVAGMLRSLLPYWRGGGIDARWLVLQGPPEFFRLTKRLHNMLYGYPAGTRLRPGDNELFEHVARVASAQGAQAVAPGDVVVLEDPQTAGLAPILRREGALVVWRCHVGADRPNEHTEAAWSFLRPYIERAEAFVFTRRAFVPPGLDPERVRVLPPAIDPCSAKNRRAAAARGRSHPAEVRARASAGGDGAPRGSHSRRGRPSAAPLPRAAGRRPSPSGR